MTISVNSYTPAIFANFATFVPGPSLPGDGVYLKPIDLQNPTVPNFVLSSSITARSFADDAQEFSKDVPIGFLAGRAHSASSELFVTALSSVPAAESSARKPDDSMRADPNGLTIGGGKGSCLTDAKTLELEAEQLMQKAQGEELKTAYRTLKQAAQKFGMAAEMYISAKAFVAGALAYSSQATALIRGSGTHEEVVASYKKQAAAWNKAAAKYQGDKKNNAAAYFQNEGYALIKAGEYKKGIEVFSRTFGIYINLNAWNNLPGAWGMLADALSDEEQHKLAAKAFGKKSLAYLLQDPQPAYLLAAQAEELAGNEYVGAKMLNEALSAYEEALDLFRRAGSSKGDKEYDRVFAISEGIKKRLNAEEAALERTRHATRVAINGYDGKKKKPQA